MPDSTFSEPRSPITHGCPILIASRVGITSGDLPLEESRCFCRSCGWAVNARARISIPFGTALTRMARLPEGAARSLRDPYAEKRSYWKLYLVLGVVVAEIGRAHV